MYWFWKIIFATVVSNSTSPVSVRLTLKAKGFCVRLNLSLFEVILDEPPGRGKTDSGTWYTC
jgi:hypothetical protein